MHYWIAGEREDSWSSETGNWAPTRDSRRKRRRSGSSKTGQHAVEPLECGRLIFRAPQNAACKVAATALQADHHLELTTTSKQAHPRQSPYRYAASKQGRKGLHSIGIQLPYWLQRRARRSSTKRLSPKALLLEMEPGHITSASSISPIPNFWGCWSFAWRSSRFQGRVNNREPLLAQRKQPPCTVPEELSF
jgi:hypothetical protein